MLINFSRIIFICVHSLSNRTYITQAMSYILTSNLDVKLFAECIKGTICMSRRSIVTQVYKFLLPTKYM